MIEEVKGSWSTDEPECPSWCVNRDHHGTDLQTFRDGYYHRSYPIEYDDADGSATPGLDPIPTRVMFLQRVRVDERGYTLDEPFVSMVNGFDLQVRPSMGALTVSQVLDIAEKLSRG